jgi:hypothetical protein
LGDQAEEAAEAKVDQLQGAADMISALKRMLWKLRRTQFAQVGKPKRMLSTMRT